MTHLQYLQTKQTQIKTPKRQRWDLNHLRLRSLVIHSTTHSFKITNSQKPSREPRLEDSIMKRKDTKHKFKEHKEMQKWIKIIIKKRREQRSSQILLRCRKMQPESIRSSVIHATPLCSSIEDKRGLASIVKRLMRWLRRVLTRWQLSLKGNSHEIEGWAYNERAEVDLMLLRTWMQLLWWTTQAKSAIWDQMKARLQTQLICKWRTKLRDLWLSTRKH